MSDHSVDIRAGAKAAHSASAANVRWLYAYLAVQIACQLALLIPALAPARVVFRVAAFATSLAFLLIVPGRSVGLGTARSLLLLCLFVLAVSGLNPEGGGALASFAHFSFHLSIIAPVFWASRVAVDTRSFEKVLAILWIFSTLSAATGVLQAMFPGRLQPPLSTVLAERGPAYVSAMSIRLSSGEWILRPMGLTDTPGGAASGALYAVLLGLGVVLARPFRGARWAGMAAMFAGMTAIYLSQVRVFLVMIGICLIALIAMMALADQIGRIAGIAFLSGGLTVLGLLFAVSLGGETVTERLGTLTTESAGTVYYKNRGLFLEHTFLELLDEFPLGAGLGRWGMMNTYFGDGARSLWVEIQWTGWLYDGGILLLILYPAAVLVTLWTAASVARTARSDRLRTWASLVTAYDVGTVALMFSYPVFMSTGGLEFWLINTALMAAHLHEQRATLSPQPAAPPS